MPLSPPSLAKRPLRRLVLVACLAVVAACKSAGQYRKDADDDVRKLVESRRAKLSIGDPSFTIAPRPESLRQRILRGDTSELPPLRLPQVLEIAAENNRDYQTRKEILYLSALDLTLERWRFGWQPSAGADAIVDGIGDEAEVASAGTRFSLRRLLGTGAVVAGDIGLGFARSLTSGDTWHPIADFGGSISQPLLAGSSPAIVLEPLTQAERNLVYAVRTFERFRRTFAVDAANRWYRLLQAADTTKNQDLNYRSLVTLRERNEELAKAGRLSDIDVGQARQDELTSKNSLLLANERFANQEDDFKLFLGLPIDVTLAYDVGELEELVQKGLEAIDLAETPAFEYALANRLDYRNVADQRDDAARKVHVAEDALRGGLLLTASARAHSTDGRPLEFDFQDTTWSIGAVLDLPIDRLPERNTYRETLIALDASTRNVEQSADQIRNDLRQELRAVASRASSYEIQRSAADLAQRRIESTSLKLEAGRADTRSLLEAQRALLDARNAVTGALVEYTLARFDLYRDLELLRVDAAGLEVADAELPPAAE